MGDGVLQGALERVTSMTVASAERSKENAPNRDGASTMSGSKSKRVKPRLTQHLANVKAANAKDDREDVEDRYKRALKEGTALVQKGGSVRKVAKEMNDKYNLGGEKRKITKSTLSLRRGRTRLYLTGKSCIWTMFRWGKMLRRRRLIRCPKGSITAWQNVKYALRMSMVVKK